MSERIRGIYGIERGQREDPRDFARRLALAMALSPRPGSPLASRFPAVLERPTLPSGGRKRS